MTFHCFFEQSGTFKNEFKKLGYDAYDYDILNDFGETDYVVDIFNEIEVAYTHTHTQTIFDNVKTGDQIIAFFPCVRFSNQAYLHFQCKASQTKKYSDRQKVDYDMKLHSELHRLYMLINKLTAICLDRNIPLIIENPYSQEHYLTRYWGIRSSVIDTDRKERGDHYHKPTQYWFIGRKPSNNLIFEATAFYPNTSYLDCERDGNGNVQVRRSLMTIDYANRFIREFVI